MNKTVTFSYDDGVMQDMRLIRLFDKYRVKATFNLNSGLLGTERELDLRGVRVRHDKVSPDAVRQVYAGHEVAGHTLTHPLLPRETDAEIVRQVEEDRLALSRLWGREVVGFAYPGGGVNFDGRVASLLKRATGVRYARTTVSSHAFDYPSDPWQLQPTVHHTEWDALFSLAETWNRLAPDTPRLFYIWGHSYEFDADDSWGKFEDFLRLIAGRPDTAYLTNRDALTLRE